MNRETKVLRNGTKVPFVAASAPVPGVIRDPQPGGGRSALPGQPFPLDNARTRRVRPISSEQLAKIMRETSAPHPDDGEYGVSRELEIIIWGMLGISAVCFAALALVR